MEACALLGDIVVVTVLKARYVTVLCLLHLKIRALYKAGSSSQKDLLV